MPIAKCDRGILFNNNAANAITGNRVEASSARDDRSAFHPRRETVIGAVLESREGRDVGCHVGRRGLFYLIT